LGTRTATPATRTEAQKAADERIAQAAETGDWSGLARTVLFTPEGARALAEHRRDLEPASFRANTLQQPFRWKERVFHIVRSDYADGKANVELVPQEPVLAAELERRIEMNRFHVLPYYQGFGFIALPEDYSRYEER
jgi:hypothetical protein